MLKNQEVTTTSLIVSEEFNKNHFHIIRDIKNLEKELGQSKNGLTKFKEMFQKSSYISIQNKKQPMYIMNRDGFMLLVMGFTGVKALNIKVNFIEAFNNMENYIRENEKSKIYKQNTDWLITRNNGKLVRRNELDVISEYIIYSREQGSKSPEKYYIHFTKIVNSLVGIKSGMRDKVDFETLIHIINLENLIMRVVREGMENRMYYKEIYQLSKKKCEEYVLLLGVRMIDGKNYTKVKEDKRQIL